MRRVIFYSIVVVLNLMQFKTIASNNLHSDEGLASNIQIHTISKPSSSIGNRVIHAKLNIRDIESIPEISLKLLYNKDSLALTRGIGHFAEIITDSKLENSEYKFRLYTNHPSNFEANVREGDKVFYTYLIESHEEFQDISKIVTTIESTTIPRPFIIAAIGDSFGSGEGNPENPCSDPNELWEPYGGFQCHRSSNASSALFYQRINSLFPINEFEVHFKNFSCSGASINFGLLGGYNGIESGFDLLESQISQVRNWIDGDLNLDEFNLDLLILSIGINDLGGESGGFGGIVTKWLVCELAKEVGWCNPFAIEDPNYLVLKILLEYYQFEKCNISRSGVNINVPPLFLYFEEREYTETPFNEYIQSSLNALDSKLRELHLNIKKVLNPSFTMHIEYPSIALNEGNELCGRVNIDSRSYSNCGMHLIESMFSGILTNFCLISDPVRYILEGRNTRQVENYLTMDFFQFANETVATLNNIIESFSNENNLIFLKGLRRYTRNKGICAEDSYFRTIFESLALQGNEQGGLHPNNKAHELLSRIMEDYFNDIIKPDIRPVTLTDLEIGNLEIIEEIIGMEVINYIDTTTEFIVSDPNNKRYRLSYTNSERDETIQTFYDREVPEKFISLINDFPITLPLNSGKPILVDNIGSFYFLKTYNQIMTNGYCNSEFSNIINLGNIEYNINSRKWEIILNVEKNGFRFNDTLSFINQGYAEDVHSKIRSLNSEGITVSYYNIISDLGQKGSNYFNRILVFLGSNVMKEDFVVCTHNDDLRIEIGNCNQWGRNPYGDFRENDRIARILETLKDIGKPFPIGGGVGPLPDMHNVINFKSTFPQTKKRGENINMMSINPMQLPAQDDEAFQSIDSYLQKEKACHVSFVANTENCTEFKPPGFLERCRPLTTDYRFNFIFRTNDRDSVTIDSLSKLLWNNLSFFGLILRSYTDYSFLLAPDTCKNKLLNCNEGRLFKTFHFIKGMNDKTDQENEYNLTPENVNGKWIISSSNYSYNFALQRLNEYISFCDYGSCYTFITRMKEFGPIGCFSVFEHDRILFNGIKVNGFDIIKPTGNEMTLEGGGIYAEKYLIVFHPVNTCQTCYSGLRVVPPDLSSIKLSFDEYALIIRITQRSKNLFSKLTTRAGSFDTKGVVRKEKIEKDSNGNFIIPDFNEDRYYGTYNWITKKCKSNLVYVPAKK